MATVTYRNGCTKKNASVNNIRKFAKKANIQDLNELVVALKMGEVYAWETGWFSYYVQEDAKDNRAFYITSIYNEQQDGATNMSEGEGAEWIWKLCHKMAKERNCNKVKFFTRRMGMARWSRQFGFECVGYTMELPIKDTLKEQEKEIPNGTRIKNHKKKRVK